MEIHRQGETWNENWRMLAMSPQTDPCPHMIGLWTSSGENFDCKLDGCGDFAWVTYVSWDEVANELQTYPFNFSLGDKTWCTNVCSKTSLIQEINVVMSIMIQGGLHDHDSWLTLSMIHVCPTTKSLALTLRNLKASACSVRSTSPLHLSIHVQSKKKYSKPEEQWGLNPMLTRNKQMSQEVPMIKIKYGAIRTRSIFVSLLASPAHL